MEKPCETSYSGRVVLDKYQIIALISYDVIVMVLNFVFNLLVILSLLWSRQIYNTSLKLIMYLSISDCCIACIVQPLFATLLLKYPTEINCRFEMTVQFFAILFTHTSIYTIVLIGYDRLARVKYMTKYTSVVTDFRVKCLMAIMTVLSVVQASMYVVGTKLSFFGQAKQIAVLIDFILAASVLAAYILTVYITRKARKNAGQKDMLKSVDRTITSLASKILLAIVLFYMSYVIISMVNTSLRKKVDAVVVKWLEFLLFFGYLLAYTNSVVNALIFLSVNKKARKALWKRMLKNNLLGENLNKTTTLYPSSEIISTSRV